MVVPKHGIINHVGTTDEQRQPDTCGEIMVGETELVIAPSAIQSQRSNRWNTMMLRLYSSVYGVNKMIRNNQGETRTNERHDETSEWKELQIQQI